MSDGPALERDPACASSDADGGTQLGGVTRVLTAVLAFALRVRMAFVRALQIVALVLLRRILVVVLRPLIALSRIAGRIVHALGHRLSHAVGWMKGKLGVVAQVLLAPIRAIIASGRALLAPAMRRLRLLARLLLTVILKPLVALLRSLTEIASVLWFLTARLLRAVGAFILRLLRSMQVVLRPFTRACQRFGELLRSLGVWFGELYGRSRVRALLTLGVLLLAATTITVIASPSSHSASYPVFQILDVLFGGPLVIMFLAGLVKLVELLLRRPLVLLRKLARYLMRPLVALANRVDRWMNRIEHSVVVASTKATFQTTRSSPAALVVPDADGRSARTPHLPFRAEIYQNEYLARRGAEVNAVITVTAEHGYGSLIDGAHGSLDDTRTSAPEAAEVILLDCSGSMAYPLDKLREAQRATEAAIDSLREGTWFALVRSTERAQLAYPPTGSLAQASTETKRAAKRAVQMMWPEGGTAMGRWLTLARDLLASRPGAICHAILLTDGSNESETREELESALAECEGRFQCDCRGVGTDWRVKELRLISSRLLGTLDIVAEPHNLEADFRSLIDAAMGKVTSDVSLRLWTPQGATVAFLKQVSPAIEDLTNRATPVDALTADYPTGAWGEESRDYHLCVQVPAKETGDELLAARVSVMMRDHVASQALAKAVWTDDEQLSTRINREVAHYTGQAELADAIQEGLEARKQGDEHTATHKLGRAVALATAAGNTDTTKLLEGVVDIQDPHTGTVRLKRRIDDADEMALDTRSTKTTRVRVATA